MSPYNIREFGILPPLPCQNRSTNPIRVIKKNSNINKTNTNNSMINFRNTNNSFSFVLGRGGVEVPINVDFVRGVEGRVEGWN